MKNFERIKSDIDVRPLLTELQQQSEYWDQYTGRQDKVTVQAETQSIPLRGVPNSAIGNRERCNVHESRFTRASRDFPKTVAFIRGFAEERNAQLARAKLVNLPSGSRVYRHRDRGEYYRSRDRYHLVLCTGEGNALICGGEQVFMRSGELWWFNNKQFHESYNDTDDDRIHLIFDLLPAGVSKTQSRLLDDNVDPKNLEVSRAIGGSDDNVATLKNWTPYRIRVRENSVHWIDLGKTPFTGPSFSYAIERTAATRPQLDIVESNLSTIEKLREINPGLAPRGFVFHTGRCGSTLLANVLGAMQRHVVLHEPEPVDTILTAKPSRYPLKRRISLLQGAISALGQRRLGVEEALVIKLNSWHILKRYRELIMQAYPDCKWVFIYRDPVEVMMSLLSMRNVRRSTYFIHKNYSGLSYEERLGCGMAELVARSVGRYCEAAAEAADDNTLLINYSQLSPEIFRQALDFFELTVTDDEFEATCGLREYHAKDRAGELRFKDDSAAKQLAAPTVVREMAEKWAMEGFRKVEEKRQSQAGAEHLLIRRRAAL